MIFNASPWKMHARYSLQRRTSDGLNVSWSLDDVFIRPAITSISRRYVEAGGKKKKKKGNFVVEFWKMRNSRDARNCSEGRTLYLSTLFPFYTLLCISSSFLFIGRILARFVDVLRLRFFNKPLTSCLNLCSFSWLGFAATCLCFLIKER